MKQSIAMKKTSSLSFYSIAFLAIYLALAPSQIFAGFFGETVTEYIIIKQYFNYPPIVGQEAYDVLHGTHTNGVPIVKTKKFTPITLLPIATLLTPGHYVFVTDGDAENAWNLPEHIGWESHSIELLSPINTDLANANEYISNPKFFHPKDFSKESKYGGYRKIKNALDKYMSVLAAGGKFRFAHVQQQDIPKDEPWYVDLWVDILGGTVYVYRVYLITMGVVILDKHATTDAKFVGGSVMSKFHFQKGSNNELILDRFHFLGDFGEAQPSGEFHFDGTLIRIGDSNLEYSDLTPFFFAVGDDPNDPVEHHYPSQKITKNPIPDPKFLPNYLDDATKTPDSLPIDNPFTFLHQRN